MKKFEVMKVLGCISLCFQVFRRRNSEYESKASLTSKELPKGEK